MPLDPEELADAEARRTRGGRDDASAVGEIVVLRRLRHIMPFVIGLMLAPILVGLQAPFAGGALGAAVVIAFFVHRARRVARLRIGADGSFALLGHAEIDWATLRRLEVRYRYPWGASRRARVYDETLDVRFVLADGRRIRLARGPLFRRLPSRAPLAAHVLERWLKRRAQSAGLRIDRDGGPGWIATRPTAA